MVAHAFRRSKACATCRQRRVKCDLQRPGCSQCQRVRDKCPGYVDGCIFVGVATLGQPDSAALKTKRTTPLLSAETVANDEPEEELALEMLASNIAQGPIYRQQLLQHFIWSYVPQSTVGFIGETSWPVLVSQIKHPTKALELSFTALAASALGRAKGDDALIADGMRNYGRGLVELRSALEDPSLLTHDGTLAACHALLLHEVVECTADARSGFISHQRGASQLIKMRGPKAHGTPLARRIFSTVRLIEAMTAFNGMNPSFLSSRRWKTVPWAGETKPIYERVVDLLLAIPAKQRAAQELDSVVRQRHAKIVFDQIMFYRDIDHRLLKLQKELEKERPEASYWPLLSTWDNSADDDVLGKVFPVSFCFPNLGVGMTLLLLWTTQAVIWTALEGLDAYLARLARDQSIEEAAVYYKQLPKLGHDKGHWLVIARHACQCVEYCLQEPVSGFAQMTVAIPLQLLQGFFAALPECRRELEWTKCVIDSLGRQGLRLLQYGADDDAGALK